MADLSTQQEETTVQLPSASLSDTSDLAIGFSDAFPDFSSAPASIELMVAPESFCSQPMDLVNINEQNSLQVIQIGQGVDLIPESDIAQVPNDCPNSILATPSPKSATLEKKRGTPSYISCKASPFKDYICLNPETQPGPSKT